MIFGSTAFIAYREHVKRQQVRKSKQELPKSLVH